MKTASSTSQKEEPSEEFPFGPLVVMAFIATSLFTVVAEYIGDAFGF